MVDVLPGLWSLTPIGAVIGLLVILYWLLSTGRIITRASHERELAMANKRGDEWRDSTLDTRSVNAELLKQNGQLIEGAKISEHFFRSSMSDTITKPEGV